MSSKKIRLGIWQLFAKILELGGDLGRVSSEFRHHGRRQAITRLQWCHAVPTDRCASQLCSHQSAWRSRGVQRRHHRSELSHALKRRPHATTVRSWDSPARPSSWPTMASPSTASKTFAAPHHLSTRRTLWAQLHRKVRRSLIKRMIFTEDSLNEVLALGALVILTAFSCRIGFGTFTCANLLSDALVSSAQLSNSTQAIFSFVVEGQVLRS